MVRMRGGDTPIHSQTSLCLSCRCSQVTHGQSLDEDIVLCHNRGSEPWRVRIRVSECSDYEDKSLSPLWEMEKIAWRVSADKLSGRIGFLDPKQYKVKHPNEDD